MIDRIISPPIHGDFSSEYSTTPHLLYLLPSDIALRLLFTPVSAPHPHGVLPAEGGGGLSLCTSASRPPEPLRMPRSPPGLPTVCIGDCWTSTVTIPLPGFCPDDSVGHLCSNRMSEGLPPEVTTLLGLLPSTLWCPHGSVQPPVGAVPDLSLSLFLPFAFLVRLLGPIWVFTGQLNG